MNKPATPQYPIHELIRERWSPRTFSGEPVEESTLRSLFEAARWAPSSMNAQPWAFFVASCERNPAAFALLADTLSDNNRRWAPRAPVLVLTLARIEREPGKPNRAAPYDLGQAVALMTVQATALGLRVRQMGGFDAEKVRRSFGVPAEYEPRTILAIGYPGDPNALPEDLREREQAARERRPQDEFVKFL